MPDPRWVRPLGLALGYAADTALGDPVRRHPVAGFGHLAEIVEQRSYADSRAAGAAHAALLVGTTAAAGAVLDRLGRGRPVLGTAVTAAATWTVLGGRSLDREAGAVRRHLEAGDLEAARARVTHLVGRDPTRLDVDGIARATVESLAENTSDAVVAPLLWGAACGSAGLLGYRAANTLDAMVGHRSPRYRRFGWASARLDDLLNLAPARLTALVAAVSSPLVGGHPDRAVATWQRDAHRHPSPNAGPVEASFAGALGITLGGMNRYGDATEDRGRLGSGPPASPGDVARAARLARAVGLGSLSLAVGASAARRRRR